MIVGEELRKLIILIAMTAVPVRAALCRESFLSKAPSERLVKLLVDHANANLAQAVLRDGSSPSPISNAERSAGVIPFKDASRIVHLGQDTAIAQWCGLDWEQLSFLPVMRRERSRERWSGRQHAFIGLLHGISQGFSYRELSESQKCSSELASAAAFTLSQKYRTKH